MKKWAITIFCFLFSLTPLAAREVGGIKLDEQITISATPLILNGAGIRTKFIFDIYVGALYLKEPARTAAAVLNSTTTNRLRMVFLYDEVDKEKLTNGWNDGFENNLSSADLDKLKTKITAFNQLFETVHKGDIIDLDYIVGKGTHVYYNSKLHGIVQGKVFNTALLKIWLGNDPADDDLKEGMLGQGED
jgi:hypothetical protein